jgi:hypothetical protein
MLDKAAASALLKELYTDEKLQNTLYPDNAMYAWLPKKSAPFVGSQHPIPIIYGNPQSVSADPSVAFGASPTSTKSKRFVITRAFKYGGARITREMLKAGDGDKGSFIDLAEMEMDGGLHAMTRRIAVELFRDGTGCIGKVAAGAPVNNAGGVLQIGNYNGGTVGSDVDNFEQGMLVVAAASATGALRAGQAYVVSVDRTSATPTVTLSATDGGAGSDPSALITGLTAGDFIFAKGDAMAGSGVPACVIGADGWLPTTAPTAGDSFGGGVDRSADPQRLAGCRIDGTSGTNANAPLKELLVKGSALTAKFGGRPGTGFVNWENWSGLEIDLGQNVVYGSVKASDNADIGFRSITIHGGRVPIEVVPDQNCPASRFYLLDQSTWGLYHLGDLPEIVDDDGVIMLRATGADAYDIRFAGTLQTGCSAPGKNCVGKLS